MSIRSMTPEQRHNFIQRYLLYPTVALIGVVIIYFIFAPPSKEQQTQSEFNVTVPEAEQEQLAESKKIAYAKEQTKQADEDRETMITLAQKMIGEKRESPEVTPTQKVAASTEAYRNMNRTVGSFYTTTKVDTEKERMRKELEELKAQIAKGEQNQPSMGMEEQITLMEKSYELAAKYSPNGQGAQQQQPIQPAEYLNGKAQVNSVEAVASTVVSSLGGWSSSPGFNTAVGGSQAMARNTIAAVVHSDQTITNGAAVRLRLTEEMMVGDKLLPRNSILTGIGRVQGERLQISISNIEHQGYILPVEIVVVDSDGVEGIHVPNSMEVSALKSIVANMSSSASSTITIADQSAGDQILTELGTSAIDGVTQYVAGKVKEVKVHLKAGHQVMLYQRAK
ncbi:MAG: conjugative transposon protein TraM [Rikenellaceae bacterium]